MKKILLLFFAFHSIPNCSCQSNVDHFYAGNNKFEQKKYQQAINEYTKCIEENPDFESAYLNRGCAKVQISDFRGAIIDYNKLIKINGRSDDAYYSRGIAKGKFGDHIGAILDYCTTIEINHKYADAYYYRGLEKIFLKQVDGGCLDLKKAAELKFDKAVEAIKEHCK